MSATVSVAQASLRDLPRLFAAWLAGSIVAYILGSISQSVVVLRELNGVTAGFPLQVWVDVIVHDLLNLAFGGKFVWYGSNLLIAFAVAFPCAIVAARVLKMPLALVASVAGATALVTMVMIVNANFTSNVFAGTYGVDAMFGQAIAGAIGGLVFFTIFARRRGEAA